MREQLKKRGDHRAQEDIADFLEWILNTLDEDLNELCAFLQAAAPSGSSNGSVDSSRGNGGGRSGSGGSASNGGSVRGSSGIIASIFGGMQRETMSIAGCEMKSSDSAFKLVRVQILDDGVQTLEQALVNTFPVELIGE